jgi:hypothetical protein
VEPHGVRIPVGARRKATVLHGTHRHRFLFESGRHRGAGAGRGDPPGVCAQSGRPLRNGGVHPPQLGPATAYPRSDPAAQRTIRVRGQQRGGRGWPTWYSGRSPGMGHGRHDPGSIVPVGGHDPALRSRRPPAQRPGERRRPVVCPGSRTPGGRLCTGDARHVPTEDGVRAGPGLCGTPPVPGAPRLRFAHNVRRRRGHERGPPGPPVAPRSRRPGSCALRPV